MKKKAYVIKPCSHCAGMRCACCNYTGWDIPFDLQVKATEGKILIAYVVEKEKLNG